MAYQERNWKPIVISHGSKLPIIDYESFSKDYIWCSSESEMAYHYANDDKLFLMDIESIAADIEYQGGCVGYLANEFLSFKPGIIVMELFKYTVTPIHIYLFEIQALRS